jgi:hypothetical protein
MAGSMPWSTAPAAPSSNDPNELLRQIDRNVGQLFRWVRFGFVVVIILLALLAIGF